MLVMRYLFLLFAFTLLSCEDNLNDQRTINAQGYEGLKQARMSKRKAARISFSMANGETVFAIQGWILLNKKIESYSCYFKKDPISTSETPFLIHLPSDFSIEEISPEDISFRIGRNRTIEFELKSGSKRLFIRDRINAAH